MPEVCGDELSLSFRESVRGTATHAHSEMFSQALSCYLEHYLHCVSYKCPVMVYHTSISEWVLFNPINVGCGESEEMFFFLVCFWIFGFFFKWAEKNAGDLEAP